MIAEPKPKIKSTESNSLLVEGENCWRTIAAARGAFIINGQDYFRAFRSALLQARERVYILAWDFNSKIQLERDGHDDGFPGELGDFILALLKARPTLHVHIVLWDFAVIYALEREWNSFSKLLGETHPRLHLIKDGKLPIGASHHQKIVVVDDRLAFCGGLDLSAWRWDTNQHLADDSRRTDPDGEPYQPYHDIETVVTGDAAKAIGDLCAYRWKRASGEDLPRSQSDSEEAPWPEGINVDFKNRRVSLARTYAAYEEAPPVREIEKFHLDVIKQACRYLYFENQYFSSRRIANALAERLEEADGPEIIIVLTQNAGGWLEESTMGLLRDRFFETLCQADKHDRLRIYYPRAVDGDTTRQVYVHAKVVIADDCLIKVGSSNLSNRSMRVDSEADIILESNVQDGVAENLKHRLLAVHFGKSPEEISDQLAKHHRLVDALDDLVSEERNSLWPLQFNCEGNVQRWLTDTQILDPDEPIDPSSFIQRTVPRGERSGTLKRFSKIAAIVGACLVLAFVLKWGWGSVVDQEAIKGYLNSIQSSAWTPVWLVAVFFVMGLTGFPVNPVLVTSALIFGPWVSLVCGFSGSLLSAVAGFGLGHKFGKPLIKKVSSKKIDKLNDALKDRGIISVMLIRLVPLAPFVLVNLAAGSSRLRFSVFNIGTALGTGIGMFAVVLFTSRLEAAIRQPGWLNILLFVVVLGIVGGGIYFLRRSLKSGSTNTGQNGDDEKQEG